jgi:type I restriction enzyme S subunit
VIGNGSIVRGITNHSLERIRVPVPPLQIQREITEALDAFAGLEAELEAELEARRLQYQHYRESLLTFSSGVHQVPLSAVCIAVSSGGTPLKSRDAYYEGGTIPWLRTQEVRFADIHSTAAKITEQAVQETPVKWIPANCVIVAISGATAGRSAVNKIPLTTNQHCCNLEIDPSKASYRYVFHWVSNRYKALKALGQGVRSDLNAGLIKTFPIALPPLIEQKRIAAMLDKFDALVNDPSVGLPAELSARRKQYEYYRDKLFTFPEAA